MKKETPTKPLFVPNLSSPLFILVIRMCHLGNSFSSPCVVGTGISVKIPLHLTF